MNKLYLVICIVGFVWASSAVGAVLNVPADYPTIQTAINAASDGDTVQVAAGAYTENLVWQNKSLALIGAGADVTTVDGGGTGRCLTMQNVPSTARVEGFTFTGGSATYGGGLSLADSSPMLVDNIITGNSALLGGGLDLRYNSCATVVGNTFTSNSADRVGGGLTVFGSSPTLTNNIISSNWAGQHGGGLWLNISSATLTSNIISGNSANSAFGGGGGLGLYHASPTLTNNIIEGNSAHHGAGLDACYYSSPTLTNNTIAGNAGGGVYNHGDPAGYPYGVGTPVITNCILWGNSGYDLQGASATYSDIGIGNLAGEGNISADPMFVDAIAGDYHLQDASPCIDVGSNSAAALPDTDKDGNPRIDGAAVDMGAYECQGPKVIAVAIDIKPGSYPNAINLGSYGLIPVAILSSDQFDATTVNPETVELAGAGLSVRGKGNKYMAHSEDVNGDGLLDLVVQVATENLDAGSLQDGYPILTGKTFDGVPIEGKDQITIVPPEK